MLNTPWFNTLMSRAGSITEDCLEVAKECSNRLQRGAQMMGGY